jgi:hypothetical protein
MRSYDVASAYSSLLRCCAIARRVPSSRTTVIRARSGVLMTVSCSSFEHVLTDQMISSILIGSDREAEECSAIML